MNRLIIDVREPEEFAVSHVKGSRNIPLSVIAANREVKNLEHEDEIILYCNSGNRSETAKILLTTQGFTKVTNGINKESVEKNL